MLIHPRSSYSKYFSIPVIQKAHTVMVLNYSAFSIEKNTVLNFFLPGHHSEREGGREGERERERERVPKTSFI